MSAASDEPSQVARDVARGLLTEHKWLPPYLFYDAEGARLYEQITRLPEYYLTRAERSIFEAQADAIAEAAGPGPLRVAELGAGTASKTQLVLEAVARRQGECEFLAIDVSEPALRQAQARLAAEAPRVRVRTLVGYHEQGMDEIGRMGSRQLVLFVGSSIGNFTDAEAKGFLQRLRRSLRSGAALLLGTDLRKDPARLVAAYDDAQGVTAAFNKNILAHINRALGAKFRLSTFRHVALWNAAESRIEMHLESTVEQRVRIEALGAEVHLREGERIHTESSVKYDRAKVDALLTAGGFVRERTFTDDHELFAVHLARA